MIAILEAYKAGLLGKKYWLNNIVSGLLVGIIALPLAMAFAIASGVNPEQGIYTAIIAAVIVGIFGGSHVQIAGPTGAFVVILASIVARHGIEGLQIATLMAGAILLLMSFFKLGNTIKFIPYPVVVGFTSGIGVIIFVNEWRDFFGLNVSTSIEARFYEKIFELIHAIPSVDPATTMLGLISLLVIILLPRIISSIPAPIIALFVAILAQNYFQFNNVETIGDVYGEIPGTLPSLTLPNFSLTNMGLLFNDALIIAFLCAIESLLSASAADTMCGTKHKPNFELFGQGLANIVAPLFGGIAATGAIARTVANVRSGGNSPLAAIIHSITLLAVIVFLAPYAAQIPLTALAAILFVVAFNMSNIPEFLHIVKNAPKPDVLVLLTTFALTITTNLVTAVAVGVILATLLFVARMQELTKVQHDTEITKLASIPKNCMVFNIDGPFFFGAAEEVEHALSSLHMDVKQVVFRLHNLSMIDMTGLETLSNIIEQYKKRHVKVYICEANKKVIAKMEKVGLTKLIEQNKVYGSISDIAF